MAEARASRFAVVAVRRARRRGESELVPVEGALHVDDAVISLTIDQPPGRVTRVEVIGGWMADAEEVTLQLKSGGELSVRLDRPETGSAFVAAALSAEHRAIRVVLPSPASQVRFGATFVVLVIATLAPALLVLFLYAAANLIVRMPAAFGGPSRSYAGGLAALAGVLALVLHALIHASRNVKIVIGNDGIAVRRLLHTEVIRYGDMTQVALDRRGVRLSTSDERVLLRTWQAGEPLFPLAPSAPDVSHGMRMRRLLYVRMREAMAERGRVAEALPEFRLEELDRRGRTLEQWVGHLAALAKRGIDYRSSRLSAEELAIVIRDTEATSERRLAAALALGTADADEAGKQVRIAGLAAADAEFSEALERAAEGEIDEGYLAQSARKG
jgi:hypothetical protein